MLYRFISRVGAGRIKQWGRAAFVVVLAMSLFVGPVQQVAAQTAGMTDPTTGFLPERASTLSPTSALDVAPTATQSACTPGALVRSVATSQPIVALTFDDGPLPNYTRGVMDAMRAHGLEGMATFFMVGDNVRNHPAIAREVAARGYGIGNHSMTHQYDPNIIASEIGPAQSLIEGTTGIRPSVFRSPGLTQGAVIQQELARQGLCNVFTRFDTNDWLTPRLSAAEICANIRNSVRAGDIILMHDAGTHLPTLQAMQTCVIETLQSLGLRVAPLDELLQGFPDKRVPAGGTIEIQAGAANQSVIGQLTVDQALGAGFLIAYPCAEGRPNTSDLNYVAGTPASNMLMVRTDANGKFCVYTSQKTHIIYDHTAALDAAVLPMHSAVRKFDTRSTGTKVAAGTSYKLRAAGPHQIVVGQLTNDQADGSGFLTAYPCAEARPITSDLNYIAGQPTSNRLIAKTDLNGDICFYAHASTHLIYDQITELAPTAATIAATRMLDTRSGSRVPVGGVVEVAAGAPGATVIAQVTTDDSVAGGFLSVYPCAEGRTVASHLNYQVGRPRSSRVVAKADSSGKLCIYALSATHLVFDKVGTAPWPVSNAVRMLDTRL